MWPLPVWQIVPLEPLEPPRVVHLVCPSICLSHMGLCSTDRLPVLEPDLHKSARAALDHNGTLLVLAGPQANPRIQTTLSIIQQDGPRIWTTPKRQPVARPDSC